MSFYINVFFSILKVVPITLFMSFISFVFALILAILIVLTEHFKIPVLKNIFDVYVSFFRGTPLIPQLFLLYFGLPTFIPALRHIPAINVCILVLTLNCAAYMKEVVRGALLSVPKTQIEAAAALGLSPIQTMFSISLPLATVVAIPSLFNNLVDLVKGSSVAFTIGIIEMTAVANLRASVTFNYFEAYIVLMLIYWIIILVLEKISYYIERRSKVWNAEINQTTYSS